MQESGLTQLVENESWDSLAKMLISLPVDFDNGDAKGRKVRKQMEALKHALYTQMMSFNGNQSVETSFFVASVKAFSGIEKKLEANGVKNSQFVMFLKLILGKIKKQKLLIKKPLEVRNEFSKMKEVVEDADSI